MNSVVNQIKCIGWLLLALLLSRCANIVAPIGGPKDLTPPKVTLSQPPDQCVSFQSKTITLTFNEFIVLKDIHGELFVSPPMSKMPDAKIKGKRLVLTLPDDLRDSTTYTLSFGKAIRDITEANILNDFTYSFSTGPVRDSLIIKGIFLDALSAEPQPGVLACLYRKLDDTAFMTEPPQFMARSNEKGEFQLRNLPEGVYRLYGLKDMNSNFFYDQPNELIGFVPGLVKPLKGLPPSDSSAAQGKDSLLIKEQAHSHLSTHEVRMFSDRDTAQKMLKAWLMKKQLILVSFRNPVSSLSIEAPEMGGDTSWSLVSFNESRDTIHCWLRTERTDTLSLILADVGKTLDTIKVSLRPMASGRGPRRDAEDKKSFIPIIGSRMPGDAHKPVVLLTDYPIDTVFRDRITWAGEQDTVVPEVEISEQDPCKLIFLVKPEPGEKYSLIVRDSAIRDFRAYYNDSSAFNMSMRKLEDYGQLRLSLVNPPQGSYFIEMLNKDKKVQQRIVKDPSGEYAFSGLLPGKYTFRLISDINENERWDPGFIRAGILAEPVHYFPGEIEVRAKWERVESWDISH